MAELNRGINYVKVKANRIAFHPASRYSDEPSFFSFILEAQLAGMAFPTSSAQLKFLKSHHNIGLVCSLIEEASCPPETMFHASEDSPEDGPDSLHVDWQDMSIPTIQQIDSLLQTTNEYIQRGLAVVYHCFGGKGRTGTALCCYLLKYRSGEYSTESAINFVRELRPNSVETASQELFIANYERHLKGQTPIQIAPDLENPKFFTVKLRKVNKVSNHEEST